MYYKYIFKFLCCLILLSCSSNIEDKVSQKAMFTEKDIKVVSSVNVANSTIYDKIKYTISATYPKEAKIIIPDPEDNIGGLRIVDFGGELDKSVDNHLECQKWYDLEADIASSYRIPEIEIIFILKNQKEITKRTQEIFITLSNEDKNPGKQGSDDIKDIKPNVIIPFSYAIYIIIAGSVFLFFLLLVTGIIFYKKYKLKSQEKVLPPHVKANMALLELESQNLCDKGEFSLHFYKMTEILKRYLEERFSFSALEMTYEEIYKYVDQMQELDSHLKDITMRFLQKAELIKFAKVVPEANFVKQSLTDTKTFIDKSKIEDGVGDV
ncbi:MAG: hypothetical protein ABIA04_00985 [Pseudomonadota bacterium]